jgi:exodeoxyribonuclease VII large subunit
MAQAPLFEEPTLTVAELSAGVERALFRAFPDEIWVRGEIANLSRRPQAVYFDLVDTASSLRVVLWNADRLVVNRVLKQAGGAVRMTDGTDVRIRVRVRWFAKRGAVSLQMLSIDPAYTLGQLAEARERLLAALHADGSAARNSALDVPLVPLHVGLLTSAGSAAAADFLHTLELSARGFAVTLVDVRVQGVEAVRSVVAGLRTLAARPGPLDVVCIVRGGGARTDLAAFDDESVARAIAAMPVPVLTGIGHEIDTSVADAVAHTSYKTPTACAAALVERVQLFVDRYNACWARIGRAAGIACDRAAAALDTKAGRVVGSSRHHVRAHEDRLARASEAVVRRAPRALDGAARHLDALTARVRAHDPARTFARGWTITRDSDGRAVRRAADVRPGAALVTTFGDGTVHSRVETVERDDA